MTASILSEAGEMVSASQSFLRVFKRLLVWGKSLAVRCTFNDMAIKSCHLPKDKWKNGGEPGSPEEEGPCPGPAGTSVLAIGAQEPIAVGRLFLALHFRDRLKKLP